MTGRRFAWVGAAVSRVDAVDKVTGAARFLADLRLPGMWDAAVATPPVAHGRILSLALPSVARGEGIVLDARGIPGLNQIGISVRDQPLMVFDTVRSMGDRLAIAAAPSRRAARDLAARVSCEIEPLPVVEDVAASLAPGAVAVHPAGNVIAELRVRRGDVAAAFAAADIVIEGVYRTGHQEHAYLEPQGAVAVPSPDGMLVYSTCQCPFYVRRGVADVLGYPLARVRVVQTCTGGGFGGKEDYPSEVAACAAVLAHAAGRPVRLVYDRDEDFRWSTKRHRTVITHRLAADAGGKILAMQVEAIYDAGAYAGLSVIVAERGNSSACGPYEMDAVEVRTIVAYTNNLFGGAFRGFGAPQVTFATERQIDELARRVGRDPADVRAMNLWRRGSTTASGEVLTGPVAARQTLREALRRSGYRRRGGREASGSVRRGVGIATSYYGNNLHKGGERLDRSHARVTINADGSVNVWVGLTEMGQGLLTSVALIAAEELGAPMDRVRVAHVDTDAVQDSGPTVASRGTIMSGMPVRRAAAVLRHRMLRLACGRFARRGLCLRAGRLVDPATDEEVLSWDELVAACHAARVEMTATGFYHPPARPYDPSTGQGRPYATNSYTTHVAEVEVDTDTGVVRLLRVTAVHDVGRTIFPEGLRGQIEGGIVQGAGLALWEELKTRQGVLLAPGFTDYAIPGIADVPEIRWATVEHPWKGGPFGAKGIGEPSLIGVPAAIANAASRALGIPIHEIPLTPERVRSLIAPAEG